MIFSWNKKTRNYNIDYPFIISLLEKGDKQSIDKLLWQPNTIEIEYLPIVYDMVMKFKNPGLLNQKITVHKTIDKDKYQLIIFEVPWLNSGVKYTPLLLDKSTSKIIGIMLPFNELHGFLSKKEHSDTGALAIEWTGFILSIQFGI